MAPKLLRRKAAVIWSTVMLGTACEVSEIGLISATLLLTLQADVECLVEHMFNDALGTIAALPAICTTSLAGQYHL